MLIIMKTLLKILFVVAIIGVVHHIAHSVIKLNIDFDDYLDF